jgi:two-component system response regulator AtoC
MSINKILVVDDEPLIRGFLKATLKRNNYEVKLAENGAIAIELLKKDHFDLIITDMKMPIKSGIDVLKFAKENDPNIIVIIMTAYGTIENAVNAMHLGAFNYIIKPFSPEAIEILIKKAQEQLLLLKENQYLREEASNNISNDIIANSSSMKKILNNIEKIAKSDASIFISGESGTGKEVIAHAIHFFSNRNKNTFIKVNCAAIAESLIESEFFGHERGAFTGAEAKKIGRFELADKGTLLLDEVTEIPISLQPKLLRALQEQEFERVGGVKPIKVNTRFIATSNRNMQEAISNNIFREDLYFRLNVMPIVLPPLRERKEDIIPLSNLFLKKFCKKYHKNEKKITPEAEIKLINYPWPGNIRELANIIERTVVLDIDDNITKEHLTLDSLACKINKEESKQDNYSSIADMEKLLIEKTLKERKNNKTQTAKILGISIRTLRNKLKEYAN